MLILLRWLLTSLWALLRNLPLQTHTPFADGIHLCTECFPALSLVIIWYVRSFEGLVPAMLAAVWQGTHKLCKPSCCEYCPTVFVLSCLPALPVTVRKIRIRPHTDVIHCKSSDINFMDNVHMQGCQWGSL